MNRDQMVCIRITEAEKSMLSHCASRLGMTQTDVIITGIQLVQDIINKRDNKIKTTNS